MTDITKLAQLRAELSNPAIGSKDHLRKLALSLVEALEKAQHRIAELETQNKSLVRVSGTSSLHHEWQETLWILTRISG